MSTQNSEQIEKHLLFFKKRILQIIIFRTEVKIFF